MFFPPGHRIISIYRLLLTFIVMFFLFNLAGGAAEARSYKFLRLDIAAEIFEDGSMAVIEERTTAFEGAYTGLYQWIYKEPGVKIVDVSVEENGVFYEFNPGTTYGPAGTYYITDEPGRFYVDWSFEAADTVRIFTLRYRVLNAVQVHNDVAELYYQFVGDEWSIATDSVFVRLRLPAGARPGEIRAWGHGPLHGDVSIKSTQEILWTTSPLPPSTYLKGRATFPPELVPGSTRQTGRSALSTILTEEEKWAASANRERLINRVAWALAATLLMVALLLIFLFWYRYGKEHKTSYTGDYYRELPAHYSPAELGVLWNFGKVSPADFTATIMDLARRGYLRLEQYVPEAKGLFRRRKTVDYRIVNMNKQEAVVPHEHDILNLLFTDVVYKQPTVTFMQIEEYAKINRDAFALFWSKWRGNLRKRGETAAFFDANSKKGKKIALLTGIILTVCGLGLTFLAGSALPQVTNFTPLILAMIASGVVITVASCFLRRRSREGAEDFVRWRAFRRFLLHFSEMQRHEIPSLIIWEHYLVYAVTLGVAIKVIKQLQLVYPGLQDGSHTFGYGWYSYHAGIPASSTLARSFESLATSIQSSVHQSLRTATSKTSSGSGGGGGFSGGGGGGGGGGAR